MADQSNASGGATVATMMTRAVITTTPGTSVTDVAAMLHQHHITGMPVLDEHQRVVGVVSEMDVVTKQGKSVADIMTTDPKTVEEEVALADVADLLMSQRIRRLPVVRHGKLVGLISRTDLVTFFAQHQWTCTACGASQRGLKRPSDCPDCGAQGEAAFALEDAPHGM